MSHLEIEHSPLQKRPSYPANSVYIIVLAAACLASVNNFFCYHEPSAIAKGFEDYYHINTKQFGSLFTIYSAPNVILVFFSGQFIDSYGLRTSSLFFSSIILISMLVAVFTPSPDSGYLSETGIYVMLLVSRFLLGLGGESIFACVSTMISRWFSSTKHLNTAMAINQASVQLFGSAAAFYILPHLGSIPLCQWVTVGVCLISLCANLVYNYFEYLYEDFLIDINEEKDIHQHFHDDYQVVANYSSFGNTDPEMQNTSSVAGSNHSLSHPMESSNIWVQSYHILQKFPVLFWLILLHVSLVSPILYTFTAFGPMYLQETFAASLNAMEAGNAISLLYMSIVAAPFTGMVIDYIGHRSWVQFFASLNIPIIFLLLIYDILDPSVCMVWMGFVFSITESNGLALISLVVPTELMGTAFGILGCCISLALLIEPAAVGWIRQSTGSFALSIWIFFSLTMFGAGVAFIVVLYDRARNNIISGRVDSS